MAVTAVQCYWFATVTQVVQPIEMGRRQVFHMNEGEVVQFGTVEDLVLNPATDYVRDFTREIPKEKFLTVGSVMGPISENIGTLSFRTRDLIADIAAKIIQSEFSARVIDDAGQNVGSLTRDQVVKIVFPNEK